MKKTINSKITLSHISQEDEMLDLVNKNDQVIGKLERSKVYEAELRNFRTVSAFLISNQGKLWVPRRTAKKRVSPLHLGFSVGGHVSSGETYEQSFERELQEELNITLSDVPYKKLGLLTPHEHGTKSFAMIYLIFTNETPDYNRQDFVSSVWLSPQQLLEKVVRGKKVQGDVLRALRHFFADRLSHQGTLLDRFAKPVILKPIYAYPGLPSSLKLRRTGPARQASLGRQTKNNRQAKHLIHRNMKHMPVPANERSA